MGLGTFVQGIVVDSERIIARGDGIKTLPVRSCQFMGALESRHATNA
jgi:hypothetical protein